MSARRTLRATRETVVATFASDGDLLRAIRACRDVGIPVEDAFGPFAVHGIDAAAGWRPTRLSWVAFCAGLFGLIVALRFQYFTSAEDWPINVGGKPFDSLPAFIPVAFETTVLFAALALVAVFLGKARLFPGKRAAVVDGVTDDLLAIEVALDGSPLDRDRTRSFLERIGGTVLAEAAAEEVSR